MITLPIDSTLQSGKYRIVRVLGQGGFDKLSVWILRPTLGFYSLNTKCRFRGECVSLRRD